VDVQKKSRARRRHSRRGGDTGPGIPPADVRGVFDPSIVARVQACGSGLGLTISHHRQAHQAQITLGEPAMAARASWCA